MKTILLGVLGIILFGSISYNTDYFTFAWCPQSEDWSNSPCYAPYQEFTDEKLKQDWEPYYDYKGEYWMEQKKFEMKEAIKNNSLEKWTELMSAHENVHFYYYLQGEAPDLNGEYLFTCNLYEDILNYKEILKEDVVLKKFLAKFPSATSSVGGIDESRPPQSHVFYEYDKKGVQASLLMRVFEGEDKKPCIVPIVYTLSYRDNYVDTEIRNSDKDVNEILEFFDSLSSVAPPLQQIKNDVALFDVVCSDGKIPAYKYDNMNVACVTEETHSKLVNRGWALLRFVLPDENPSHALCNRYDGKWHSELEGCRGITDFQCSLIGGNFITVDRICYNEICADKKTDVCTVNDVEEKYNENMISSKYTGISDVEKLLVENQIDYLPDKLVVTGGPTIRGDPGCGAVVDANSTVHWFGIDSISKPERINLFSENPNKCKANTASCFCNAQIELTAITIDELDYFTSEEQKHYASILMDYLYEENINRTPKFMIGKLNINYSDSSIGYCGEIWGTNTYGFFEGQIIDDAVMGYGIEKELPLLCAISDDAKWWENES